MLNKHVHLNGEIGVVVEASLLKNSVTIKTPKGDTFTGSMDDVIRLSQIGKLGEDDPLFEGDIFKEKGKLYKIVTASHLNSEGVRAYLIQIDEQFKLLPRGVTPSFLLSEFIADYLESVKNGEDVKRIGNVAYTQPKPPFDFSFDMKIVKRVVEGKSPVYLYAGNRKHDYEIDLIKVIFAGANIFPNESYIRKTVTYDEFEFKMTEGALQEVTVHELERVARDKMFGNHDLEDDYNDEEFQADFLD